jgi:hypothetical protein
VIYIHGNPSRPGLPGQRAGAAQTGDELDFFLELLAIQAGKGSPSLGGSFIETAIVKSAVVAAVESDFSYIQCFFKLSH